MKEQQGIAFAGDLKRIYVASGKDGKLRIYDSGTLKRASPSLEMACAAFESRRIAAAR